MEITTQQLVTIIGRKQIEIEVLAEQVKALSQPCPRPCCTASPPEGTADE